MNAKIMLPIMLILVAAVSLSGAAQTVYAEEINEATVVHEAPPRETDSGPVIVPAPEDADSEPLVIAPNPQTDTAGKPTTEPVIMPEPSETTDARPEPVAPAPDSDNEAQSVVTVTETDEARPQIQIIGGNRDEHGCLGTAGYLWDQESQACVRPWSGEVQSETVVVPHGDLIGLEEPAASEGQAKVSEASFTGPVEWLFDAIAGFFQGILGWFAG